MIAITAVIRLASDPETRDAGGTPVLKFRGASNEKRKSGEVTTWLSCEAFGEHWTKLAQYMRKGEKVAISGTFSSREYTANNGEKRTSNDVRVQNIELLGTKPKDGGAAQPTGSDEDIPF